MQRITDVSCKCTVCDWQGNLDECEQVMYGLGKPGCPDCWEPILVVDMPFRKSVGRFEAILRCLCNWRFFAYAMAVLIAVIIGLDAARSGDVRNWAWLFSFVALTLLCVVQWENMRRLGVVIGALEQLLGPDLDGAAHPEMAGTLERLRFWWDQVRQC